MLKRTDYNNEFRSEHLESTFSVDVNDGIYGVEPKDVYITSHNNGYISIYYGETEVFGASVNEQYVLDSKRKSYDYNKETIILNGYLKELNDLFNSVLLDVNPGETSKLDVFYCIEASEGWEELFDLIFFECTTLSKDYYDLALIERGVYKRLPIFDSFKEFVIKYS